MVTGKDPKAITPMWVLVPNTAGISGLPAQLNFSGVHIFGMQSSDMQLSDVQPIDATVPHTAV